NLSRTYSFTSVNNEEERKMSTIELNTSITDAEWEVMRVVWANDLVTSKTVISVLKEKMDWTESTIKTILGRLVEKGVLNTEQEGRKFIYTANIVEKEAVRDFAEDIFNRICKKKVGNVIGSIIEDHVLSFDDIDRLEKILEIKKSFAVEEVDCQCTEGQCDCHEGC
ncbi:transcriptional repressor CopY, partial [Streptococcus agalactiae 18RS21]